MVLTVPPQGIVKSLRTGLITMPILGYTRKAYIHGAALNPVNMYEKMDQQFENYATPWELVWSDLSSGRHGRRWRRHWDHVPVAAGIRPGRSWVRRSNTQ